MNVGPLIVHIGDPVDGVVVLHPGTRQFAAAPVRLAAAVVLARRRLAEDAPVIFRRNAVIVAAAGMLGRLADWDAIRREFGEPRPEIRVDVALENLSSGQDM